MYDVVIVGNGPAGISCALTARRRNLKTAILSNSIKSNLLWKTDQIDNYPGMPMVSGAAMLESFEKQALDMGVEIKTGLVRQIMKNEDIFMLLQGDDIIEAKSVVLCLGVAKPKYIEGESMLIGNGVSYCATCDAMFYKNKSIAVISENEDGVEEANFLKDIVGSINYFVIKKHDMSELNKDIKILDKKVIKISKESSLVKLEFNDGFKEYDGVFVFRSAVSIENLIFGLETSGAYINTDKNMATNIDGLYAAGDCTGQPLQIAKAVGEGNIAALSVAKYLK